MGAVIVDPSARAFVQKRGPERRLFPGCWDIAGGHIDPGETIWTALAREIQEETGWSLRRLVALIEVFDWEAEDTGRLTRRREFDFLVTVDGDLARPRLERSKVSECRWITLADVDLLYENQPAGDDAIYRVVRQGLEQYQQLVGPQRE